MKNSSFDSIFSSESCVFCHHFCPSLNKCHLWLYRGIRQLPNDMDLFQTKIKCEKLSLYSFWNLSCICMPVHAYALLECAYAYVCMRAHTLGFPVAFLFWKYFYSSKKKLYIL